MRQVPIAFCFVLCAALASAAFADNDKGKGKVNGGGHGSDKAGDDRGRPDRGPDPLAGVPSQQQIVIIDRDRNTVRTYYRTEYDAGRCPPGLAKKNNGCLPPGQAKKAWTLGQPLPSQVAYEAMPRALWRQLTPPPAGYDYVRVGDDIVLMSTTTRVIAGLLGNLGNFND